MLRPRVVLPTLLAISLTWGCAAAPPPAASSPAGPAPAPAAPTPTPEDAARASDAERIPDAPVECKAFSERTASTATKCADEASALESLSQALERNDVAQRDAQLTSLESCTALPPGIVRALRAELAPTECGDVLVEPLLATPPAGLSTAMRDVLLGLSYASRAARLVQSAPRLEPPWDKPRVQQFVQGPLKQWIEGQAKAIYGVSLRGSNLSGYAKGIVAVEAGLADLRFVGVAREAPIPDDLARDPELKDAYYGSLEQALEPRKVRGRDAALVGLRKLAEAGIISDPRVERARRLLSELYAGRRIDALDSLLLPVLAPPPRQTTEQKLASLLPTFYAGILLGNADATQPALLRALLERGLDPAVQTKLASTKLSAASRQLLARAHFALGQRYWRASDFDASAKLLSESRGPTADETALVAALARVLRTGPKDAADMMLRGPHLPQGVGEVAPLDQLGKKQGAIAGMAAFDAARLLEIARPADAEPDYFVKVAERYEAASKQLVDASQKANALERAGAARATAKAISGN